MIFNFFSPASVHEEIFLNKSFLSFPILEAGGVDESSWALEAQAWQEQEKMLVYLGLFI